MLHKKLLEHAVQAGLLKRPRRTWIDLKRAVVQGLGVLMGSKSSRRRRMKT